MSSRLPPAQPLERLKLPPQLEVGELRGKHQPGPQPVVQVVGRVGQFVGDVGDLCLEMSALLRVIPGGIGDVVFRFVLDDAFAQLPGQIQAREIRVSLFELGDDAQRLPVVIEPAVRLHHAGQRRLAGMPEGRVTEVMGQADRFDQVLVGRQRPGDRAADLGHFQRVRQAGAVVVSFGGDEDLRLVLEAAEGGRVQDAIAVALERGPIGGFRLRIGAAAQVAAPHRIGRQGGGFEGFQSFAGLQHVRSLRAQGKSNRRGLALSIGRV